MANEQNKPFQYDFSSSSDKNMPWSAPSPTNVPGVSPQEAAANAIAIPKISEKPTPTEKKATIWNPNTGEKKVINVGEPVPSGFSLWTGGTASGQQARESIMANAKPTIPQIDSEKIKLEDMAADALSADENVDESPAEETPTEPKWQTPKINEILDGFGIEKLSTTDFTSQYENLKLWQDNQLLAIDNKYEAEFQNQEKKNQQVTSALQAKLIKAGVSIDGTSFESAVAGQESRNSEEIRKLERMKAQEQSEVRSGYYTNYLNLSKQEREESFNVMTTNINNMFKGYDLATNIWEAFNKRENDQRVQEQNAQEHLDNMMVEWAKLDNNQRADNLNMLESFVSDGLYDVYNEDVVNNLYRLEKLNGLEQGTLVDAAVGGYWDRMSNISLKEAQTESMMASAEKTRATLPLTLEQMKADLQKTRVEIGKIQKDMAESANGLSSSEKAFFSDVENGLDDLSKGRTWGEVWNRIAIKNDIDPTSNNPEDVAQVALLDKLLNKDFWYNTGLEDLKKSKVESDLQNKEFGFVQFDPDTGQLITSK